MRSRWPLRTRTSGAALASLRTALLSPATFDLPGSAPASSNASLDAFIRERADTMMHYTSTCRMAPRVGADGKLGVVDASLRVYGVQNVRVADASIIPVAPASHPQAMVYAIAEKCADMMLSVAV